MTQEGQPTSSTIARRWGVRPGMRIWFGGRNLHAKRAAAEHLAGTLRPPTGPVEQVFITPKTVDEAVYFVNKLRHRLASGGSVWVIYPRPGAPRSREFHGQPPDLTTQLAEHGFIKTDTVPVGDDHLSSRFQPSAD